MYTVLKSRQKWNGIKTLSYACQFCDAEDLGLNSFLYRQQKNKKKKMAKMDFRLDAKSF